MKQSFFVYTHYTPIHSHDKPNASGYVCPRCKSKVCNLPIDCKVCGLKLISSPHIARSYHHLFPVPAFKEHSADSTRSTQCYGCTATLQSKNPQTTIKISLSAAKKGSGGDGSPTVRRKSIGLKHSDSLASYQCPKCLQWFCYDCDLFIHENLHNCPGC